MIEREREKEREGRKRNGGRGGKEEERAKLKTCVKVHVRAGEFPSCPGCELGFSLYEIQPVMSVLPLLFDEFNYFHRKGGGRERESRAACRGKTGMRERER